jgi:hypothetical protein
VDLDPDRAEHLVTTVMDERGYEADDGRARLASISVEDGELSSAYRCAYRTVRHAATVR